LIELPYKIILDLVNVLSLMTIVIIKIIYTEQFQKFIKLFWNDDFTHHELKEQKNMMLFKSIILVLASVHFSFFISSLQLKLGFISPENYWYNFYLNSSVFFAFIISKKAVLHLIGYVFGLKQHSTYLIKYKFNKSIYWFFMFYLGQLLLHYSPLQALQTAKFITGLGVIYLFLNAVKFQLRFKNEIIRHWYYFILYLCTLEIAPYILLYKVVSDSLN